MAVTHLVYVKGIVALGKKETNLHGGDAIKTSLHTNTYVPSQSADDYYNDATNEITGTNYTAGGATCAGATFSSASLVVTFDAGDATWTNATFTSAARYAVTYADTAGAASTDPLLTYVNFGGDESVTSANFTVQWNASGIFSLTVS